MKIIEVLNPTAGAIGVQTGMAPHISDLNGKVIGILSNGKTHCDIFLARIEELLCQRFKFAEVVRAKKGAWGAAATPFPADQVEDFAAKCDVVVNGIAD